MITNILSVRLVLSRVAMCPDFSNMIPEIKEWLDGEHNYLVGRAIYSAFGQDDQLKALFAEGATDWNKGRLLQAMQELASGTTPKQEGDELGEMPASDDQVLAALREEWLEPYRVMKYKQSQIDQHQGDDPHSVAIREPLAFEILELEQQCMAVWEKRDYYQKHGKLPDTKEVAKPALTNPVDIAKRINGLKRNIRRNKQNAREQPAMAHYAILIQRDEAELEALSNDNR